MGDRTTEESVAEMLRFGRALHRHRYAVALDGNLSIRISNDAVLCTRSACHKGYLSAHDLIEVNLAGEVIRGSGTPTSEIALHLAAYRTRQDVHAVIHAHPPYAVAASLAGVSLMEPVLPEAVIALGGIPTLPYTRTGTHNLAAQVEGAVSSYPVVLLERHGVVAVGADMMDAFCNLETVEHTARILMLARAVRAPTPLDPEEAVALRELGAKRRRV